MMLEKYKKSALTTQEQKDVVGGLTTLELISIMWDLTPDDGWSHWENLGDGIWGGIAGEF